MELLRSSCFIGKHVIIICEIPPGFIHFDSIQLTINSNRGMILLILGTSNINNYESRSDSINTNQSNHQFGQTAER